MQHPFPKQGIIKASMERLSKVRPGGTCANLPVRGNWCSFKSGKMVQNVREFLEKSGNLKVRHGRPPWLKSTICSPNNTYYYLYIINFQSRYHLTLHMRFLNCFISGMILPRTQQNFVISSKFRIINIFPKKQLNISQINCS